MAERPILFSGPMVRAILAGTKTQTRRLLHAAEGTWWGHAGYELRRQEGGSWVWHVRDTGEAVSCAKVVRCPYGMPGDRLWVRETWQRRDDLGVVLFRADLDECGQCETVLDGEADPVCLTPKDVWRPSIHMPRKVSRLTLEVTDVRVQRLQDISEADAKAEGVALTETVRGARVWHASHRAAFAGLWEILNAKRAPWDSNPWVWAVSFRRCE